MKRVLALSIALAAVPALAEAAGAPRTLRELAIEIVDVMTYATATLVLLGLIIYMWGIASNIFKLSEGETGPAFKNYVFWGITIIFVMVSIWGILRLLQASVFDGDEIGLAIQSSLT